MKKLTVLLILFVLVFSVFSNTALASKPVEPTYYLHMDQTSVSYGDRVSFTALYPKRATRSVTTQQTDNPVVQIDCWNTTTYEWMWRTVAIFIDETRHNDGSIYGISSNPQLGGTGWKSGPASCRAWLYYIADQQLNVVTIDWFYFQVSG